MSKEIILAPAYSLGDIINEDGMLPVSESAIKAKAALVEKYNPLGDVDTIEQRDASLAALADINRELTKLEKERVSFKDPFYKMGKAIDLTVKTHIAELEAIKKRLSLAAGKFEDKLRKDAETEQRRIANEALIKAHEAQRAIEATLGAKPKPTSLEEELELQELEEVVTHGAVEMDQRLIAAAEKSRSERAGATSVGVMMRYNYEFQVVNLELLRKTYPDCVTSELNVAQCKYRASTGQELPGVITTKVPILNKR